VVAYETRNVIKIFITRKCYVYETNVCFRLLL